MDLISYQLKYFSQLNATSNEGNKQKSRKQGNLQYMSKKPSLMPFIMVTLGTACL